MAQEWSAPLLPEIWDHVFNFLPEKELFTCYKVCQDWADIVDALTPRPSWSPSFSGHHHSEASLTFRQTPGTRLESGGDVTDFLLSTPLYQPAIEKKCPFINRTLILSGSTKDSLGTLHKVLPQLLNTYGSNVSKLLYDIDSLVPECFQNLGMVFKSMGNLKSLTFNHDSTIIQAHGQLVPMDFPRLVFLRELEFLGGIHFPLVKQLALTYGKQIASLHLSMFPDYYEPHFFKELFPNLSSLKLLSSSISLQIPSPPSKLKRFAYKAVAISAADRCNNSELSYAMTLAAHSANTMELFTLQTPLPEKNSVESFILRRKFANFPVLTELAVPYFFVEEIPVLIHLMRSFPSLETMVLVDTKYNFVNREPNLEELNRLVQPLFEKVPSVLKSVVIRTRRFNKEIRRYFPKIYKCKRTLI